MELVRAARMLEQIEREREEMRKRWGLGEKRERDDEAGSKAEGGCGASSSSASAGGGAAPLDVDGIALATAMCGETMRVTYSTDDVAALTSGGSSKGFAAVPGSAAFARIVLPSGGYGGVLSATREQAIKDAVKEYSLALERSGASEPWQLVEQLGDALLDEVLTSCAVGLYAAADEEVERLAASEIGPLG